MECEVVVVGGGIGGLTVAALLAARGVDVCLLERESRVGGCVTSFEKFGYSFEPGYGLYHSWRPNEVHHRVFAELPVEPPEVRLLEPGYLVRLPTNQRSP
jgi:phytoene dehydrogenase-like protein